MSAPGGEPPLTWATMTPKDMAYLVVFLAFLLAVSWVVDRLLTKAFWAIIAVLRRGLGR